MSGDGWGKPPREPNGQFPKGVSGNRRGRPRKLERAYTPTQVRQDILGQMEEEIEIKIMGKTRRLPIILAIYWRMLLKAAEGNERMILAVVDLRRTLLLEHKAENHELIVSLEDFEKMLAQNGQINHPPTVDLVNKLRRNSKGDVRT